VALHTTVRLAAGPRASQPRSSPFCLSSPLLLYARDLHSGEKFPLSSSTPARNSCTTDHTTGAAARRGDLAPSPGLKLRRRLVGGELHHAWCGDLRAGLPMCRPQLLSRPASATATSCQGIPCSWWSRAARPAPGQRALGAASGVGGVRRPV
jgi:hypothetical protein